MVIKFKRHLCNQSEKVWWQMQMSWDAFCLAQPRPETTSQDISAFAVSVMTIIISVHLLQIPSQLILLPSWNSKFSLRAAVMPDLAIERSFGWLECQQCWLPCFVTSSVANAVDWVCAVNNSCHQTSKAPYFFHFFINFSAFTNYYY